MSRRGNCYDNAPVESFWGTLKNELVHHRRYKTRTDRHSSGSSNKEPPELRTWRPLLMIYLSAMKFVVAERRCRSNKWYVLRGMFNRVGFCTRLLECRVQNHTHEGRFCTRLTRRKSALRAKVALQLAKQEVRITDTMNEDYDDGEGDAGVARQVSIAS
jgi:hypothetical protein